MTIPESTNPLISAHKSSDSGLQVLLHPLVLLTVSDYITRHTLRGQEEPIVGALLGRQNGREISLEHAFECKVIVKDDEVILHEAWFEERLQQFKDVHKAPALDPVGWFTHTPPSGPQQHHLPIHRQLLENNESAVLLAFHPSLVASSSATAGKLPLTVYESVYEAETSDAGGKTVDVETADTDLKLRFKELPYSIETDEMEMIGIDFIAKGGGNAAAIEGIVKETEGPEAVTEKGKSMLNRKGKEKVTEYSLLEDVSTNGKSRGSESNVLDPEDEEPNAIKMLHSRIRLLNAYLSSLPPSYLTSAEHRDTPQSQTTEVNHTILRSIQALTNRLPLIIPADRTAFENEMLAEKNDVSLVALLGSLTRSVRDIREVGRKFNVCCVFTRPSPFNARLLTRTAGA
ncbi:hypothetical protein GP486_001067 [Trichoglossum hirsutum]|uniref:COP9 signalosome complex subunit 6 n=1 Tax=Trichoglossum hirsutum TaxID=265104 RepID=A0A9P8LHV1_9PEZI|nr:hypothetical protein GP486_001067 [Trichoglossum hirsutum]